MKPIIYPYKLYSASAKVMARGLNVNRIKESGEFRNNFNRLIVNWGNPRQPRTFKYTRILNNPDKVDIAIDKLATYQKLKEKGVQVPEFTTDRATALDWLRRNRVVGRSLLRGSRGRGITVYERGDAAEPEGVAILKPEDKVWQRYVTKKYEYRVHVFKGKVIDTQIKRRRNGEDTSLIRNLENGYVFCRDGIGPDVARDAIAISAVSALGLDFGGVDVLFNEKKNAYYCLEINTAPGLEGTTIDRYADAIRGYCNER